MKNSCYVSAKIKPDLNERLQKRMQIEDTSVSEIIRKALVIYLNTKTEE